MPIVSKKRHVDQETGQMVEGSSPFSSYYRPLLTIERALDWELVFADDERENNPTSFKFLQMAHAWKTNQNKGGNDAKPISFAPASSAPNRKDDDATSDMASSDGEH